MDMFKIENCPECQNPIRIIGRFKNIPEAERHTEKTVPDIAVYEKPKWWACSWSNPKRRKREFTWNKKLLQSVAKSSVAKEMLAILREQLDRIVYILSKDIEVYISYVKAKSLLRMFLANEGWRYRVAALDNLPWTFVSVVAAAPLFGHKILRDGFLHKALLEKCPEVLIVDQGTGQYVKVMNRDGAYIDLYYLLKCNHKNQNIKDYHLYESVDFWVFRGGGVFDVEYILKRTIPIEKEYFMNMIHLPEDRGPRDLKYLEIARRMIPLEMTESHN